MQYVFVDICAFSCLSLFLSDWPKKLWCRQCFGDFGTDLVFSYRKRPTLLEIVSFENRATFVGVSILQRFQVFLLSHGVYWASVSLN